MTFEAIKTDDHDDLPGNDGVENSMEIGKKTVMIVVQL